MNKGRKRKKHKKNTDRLKGYEALRREEIDELRKLTDREAARQTTILLKAVQWMK